MSEIREETENDEEHGVAVVEVYNQEKLGIVVLDSQIGICKALNSLLHLSLTF